MVSCTAGSVLSDVAKSESGENGHTVAAAGYLLHDTAMVKMDSRIDAEPVADLSAGPLTPKANRESVGSLEF